MRWVILGDDAVPQIGGIATWTAWAAQALGAKHQVAVFARHRRGLDPGVRGVRGPSFGRYGPLYTAVRAARALRRADAVLCTTWPYARYVQRIAPGVPIHIVAHGSEVTRACQGPFHRCWEQAAGRWAVSDHLVGELARRGVQAQRLPVPLPLFRGERGTRWLFVGRAIEQKGGDRFVRWVARLGVEADLVGEGPALLGWRALASRLGASVRFHGALDRASTARLQDRAAVAVLLPRTLADGSGAEGLGLALLEARARGIPVLGCRTGGVPEAVGDGWVLEDPDDLSQASAVHAWLTHAVVDPECLRRSHGAALFRERLCG